MKLTFTCYSFSFIFPTCELWKQIFQYLFKQLTSLLPKETRRIMATTAISRKYACLLFILVLHEESVKFVTASSNVKNILPPSSISLSPPRTPPRFTHVFQSDQILQPNTRLSLKCEATGHPLPQITWTLDGQSIVEHSRLRVGDYVTATGFVNSFVNISSLRVEDGGVYTCTGEWTCLNIPSLSEHSIILCDVGVCMAKMMHGLCVQCTLFLSSGDRTYDVEHAFYRTFPLWCRVSVEEFLVCVQSMHRSFTNHFSVSSLFLKKWF